MKRRTPVRRPETSHHLRDFRLSHAQRKFLAHRALHNTDAAAARAAGLSPRAVEGWKRRSPAFRRIYELALTEPLAFATAHLQALTGMATDVVQDVLTRPDATTSSRLTAVELVMDAMRQHPVPRDLPEFVLPDSLVERLKEIRNRPPDPPPEPDPMPELDVEEWRRPQPRQIPDIRRRKERRDQPLPPGVERDKLTPRQAAIVRAAGFEHFELDWRWERETGGGPDETIRRIAGLMREAHPRAGFEPWLPEMILFGRDDNLLVAFPSLLAERCPVAAKRRCPILHWLRAREDRCAYLGFTPASLPKMVPYRRRMPCDREFGFLQLQVSAHRITISFWPPVHPVLVVFKDVEQWRQRAAAWNERTVPSLAPIRIVDGTQLAEVRS